MKSFMKHSDSKKEGCAFTHVRALAMCKHSARESVLRNFLYRKKEGCAFTHVRALPMCKHSARESVLRNFLYRKKEGCAFTRFGASNRLIHRKRSPFPSRGRHGKCPSRSPILLYTAALVFLTASFFLGIMLGSTALSFGEIMQAIFSRNEAAAAYGIFWYVRLPRVCASLLCGAALAVSGAVIQGVLANRLASPSIIGVNSGAGLAVTICAALGIYGGWPLSACSFLGAFAAVMIISIASRKLGASRGTVILLGISLNSLLNAISDTITSLHPDVRFMSSDFKVGEFSAVTYQKLMPAAFIISLTIIILLTLTNELDILTLGEDNARGLGMNTDLMRTLFLLLAALLAGCAVSLAGLLSFAGLIVPHTVRRIAGNNAAHLLPLCTLFGAGFVSLCDTFSRTLFSPYEIPVGIIMAFLGVPFFVFILIKGKGGHARD